MRIATFLVLSALAFTASQAQAESVIGIGVFGGVGSPGGDMVDVSQESKSGPHFGVRIPMAFASMFSLEPFMARTEGKPDLAYSSTAPADFNTLDGYDVTAYGVNVGIGRLVNRGHVFNIAPYGGVGIHKFRRENGPSDDPFGWRAGLALGVATSDVLHLNLRGEYNKMSKILNEPDGRRYINVSLGITCVVSPR
jgi:outer membrane protein with beta-barrel domain